MTDADLLRKRRQAAAIDADPLAVFQAERDRLQAQIEELQARIAIDADLHESKVADLNQSIAAQQKVIGQLRQDLQAESNRRSQDRAHTERAFRELSDILRNEPEIKKDQIRDIKVVAVMAFTRLVAERDMAMAQAGTFQALMARIGQFLATCAQTRDGIDDLGSMRAEASVLLTETVKAQAAAPFIHSMVKAVQAADRLVKVLDQGGMPNAARAPLDQLRRELAGVPEPVRGLAPVNSTAKQAFAKAGTSARSYGAAGAKDPNMVDSRDNRGVYIEGLNSGKVDSSQVLIVADDTNKWAGFTSVGAYIVAEQELIAKVDSLDPVVVNSTPEYMIDSLTLRPMRDEVMRGEVGQALERITRPPKVTWRPVSESERAGVLTITAIDKIEVWARDEDKDRYIRDNVDAGNYPEVSFVVMSEVEGELWASKQKAFITQMERELDGTVRFFAGYEGYVYQRQSNGMIVKLRDPFDVPVVGSAEFDGVNSRPFIDYQRLLPDAADEAMRREINWLGAANVRFLVEQGVGAGQLWVVASINRVYETPGERFYYDNVNGIYRRGATGLVYYSAASDPPF